VGMDILLVEGAEVGGLWYWITNKKVARIQAGSYPGDTHIYLQGSGATTAYPKDFDYLGFSGSGLEVMMLIPNPFK